jgi:hypothetical protein
VAQQENAEWLKTGHSEQIEDAPTERIFRLQNPMLYVSMCTLCLKPAA